MKCVHCQRENRTGAKFCEQCGTAFPRACANCGMELSATAKFCADCGQRVPGAEAAPTRPPAPESYTPKHLAEKILNSGSALEGERKQVTVLFVDVVGSTSQSERLDPEEAHARMSRAIELMVEEVHRYEGTVNQFLGDGIMALFGAPIAHEDHARRAVHAALAIHRGLQPLNDELRRAGHIGLQVRQGLNTGLVVVGSIGTDLRMDYTAVGDTTNVAARLQQAAQPGSILISGRTRRLIEGYFELRSIGAIELKGKAERVPGFEVLSAQPARARIDVEADRGLTPLVGRDKEIQTIAEAFDKSKAGAGQVVLLVGEAGIGKSRLLMEFRRRIGDEVTWCEGRALSFGRTMALHPLIDMLRRVCRIEETDSEADIIEHVEHAVLALGDELKPALPYLRHLLSVDPGSPTVTTMDARLRRVEMFDALRRLFLRAAQARPQVMVFEDLHWIDPVTEEFLRYFLDSVPAARVLMLLTFRPEYDYPLGQRSYQTAQNLGPLPIEESARMADALLRDHSVPEELRALIYRKSEGNPFFVEEVVRSLQEAGALGQKGDKAAPAKSFSEILVPDTVQDAIMARIDRLGEASKRVLQLAAVIGREFASRLIDRVADVDDGIDAVMRELKAKELVYEKSLFPEPAYMFKHALTQDVAYSSLLIKHRKELHSLVGAAIEEVYADRLGEHYEVLAYHFSKAEDWEKALDYLLKSARKAVKAFGLRGALRLYEDALGAARELGAKLPVATLMEIHSARSDLFFGVSDFSQAQAEADRLLDLARQTGDRATEAGALVQGAIARVWREDFPEGVARATEAIEVSEAVGAQPALAGALFVTGLVNAVTGQHEKADEVLGRVLSISRSERDFTRQGYALFFLGALRGWHGRYRETAALGTEGVGLCREQQLVIPLIRCLWTQGIGYAGLGNYEAALAALREGLAVAEKLGDEGFLCRFLNTLGWLHIECGDLDPGLELNARSLELARRDRHATGAERAAFTLLNEGDAFMTRGDLAAASEKLQEALQIVRHPPPSRWMTWRYSTHCYASLGELALARGDPASANGFADQSLQIAGPTRSRKFESRAWRVKGDSALMRRRFDDAEEALRRSLAIAQEIDEPRQLWKSHASIGRLNRELEKIEAADRSYAAARDILERLVDGVHDPGVRAGMEAQLHGLRSP
jgi:class 3 adenylate cyclase/tetratricopeptide (TPR) repeat protein